MTHKKSRRIVLGEGIVKSLFAGSAPYFECPATPKGRKSLFVWCHGVPLGKYRFVLEKI